jgi:aspartokinase-like uncharacterized kinase
MARTPLTVLKVGGSLFDVPDLEIRLRRWRNSLASQQVILVPGGAKLVRTLRSAQAKFGFDHETAHWLAVRALKRNAIYLSGLLSSDDAGVEIVETVQSPMGSNNCVVLDCYAFLLMDEGKPGCLPHSWSVSSDSIAARVALVGNAAELILLKSVDIPINLGWEKPATECFVDSYFPVIAEQIRQENPTMRIRTINFRARPWSPAHW